ncbi:hypothetical protein PYW07_007967 [Mythimna separata]|uniref:Single domain major allergen 2 protein n=1 Tax=Mythimna separata TaxID=271217 RepID=A0AAD7YQM7_MYTSE|nr:hypothetical protein PYW07_007967 [Mythimna separata]
MKQALVVLALVGLAFCAPQPRKLFHEHVEDFIDVIDEETGDEFQQLMDQYIEFDEFWQALEYMKTNNFKDLVYEMESLPEFVAVIDFLENDNIDIHYFLDLFNELLETVDRMRLQRQSVASGKDLTAFTRDCIAMFPKEKLSALFDQKFAEDEEFRTAIENLNSEEWDTVFGALWDSDVFKAEVQTLADNGIDVGVFIEQIVAIFGQN